MIIPAKRLMRTLDASLRQKLSGSAGFGSDESAVLAALSLLENRATDGVRLCQDRLARLRDQIDHLIRDLVPSAAGSTYGPELRTLRSQIASSETLSELEEIECRILSHVRAFGAIVEALIADNRLDHDVRQEAAIRIARSDAEQIEVAARARDVAPAASIVITPELLAAYLRRRFDDETIEVTSFRKLPGGYGKETTLFGVKGTALTGEFVLRRDHVRPVVDNECHRTEKEFPVIRAVYENGFAAPEALWVDTEHSLLPGGNFIVMRRSPGETCGDVFGTGGSVPSELIGVLARSLAKLHSLPAFESLGDLTETINREMWGLSLRDATLRNVTAFRGMYLRQMAEPLPAVIALYAWAVEHAPRDPSGKPVLLHGDVGFHNMLFENGRLTALLDWEHAHVGDPAEDLAYFSNMLGRDAAAWKRLMAEYRTAGGCDIDPERLHYFKVWGHLRNATSSSLSLNTFIAGGVDELKYAHTGFFHLPVFLRTAAELIAAGAAPD